MPELKVETERNHAAPAVTGAADILLCCPSVYVSPMQWAGAASGPRVAPADQSALGLRVTACLKCGGKKPAGACRTTKCVGSA